MTSKWCQNYWAKCFQLNPHHVYNSIAIRNHIKPNLRLTNQVHSIASTNTQNLPYPSCMRWGLMKPEICKVGWCHNFRVGIAHKQLRSYVLFLSTFVATNYKEFFLCLPQSLKYYLFGIQSTSNHIRYSLETKIIICIHKLLHSLTLKFHRQNVFASSSKIHTVAVKETVTIWFRSAPSRHRRNIHASRTVSILYARVYN